MARENAKVPGIKESKRFLNFEEKFRQIGFIVLVCIIVVAILGGFSEGYISETSATNQTRNVTVDYQRFGRLQTEFKFKIAATPHPGEKSIYRIAGDFNQFYEPENIWPQPDSMYSKGDDLYLVYNNAENHNDTSIWVLVTPTRPGSPVSRVQLNGEPEVAIRQFIYP